jgi:hypothetical protein
MLSGVLEQSEATATIRRGDIHLSSLPLEITAPIPVPPPLPPVPDEAMAKAAPAESEVAGVYTVQEEDEEVDENTEM